MDTDHQGTATHARAVTTASRLRERLAAIGIPAAEVSNIVPASDILDRGYVRMGTVSVASAELILAALSGPTS